MMLERIRSVSVVALIAAAVMAILALAMMAGAASAAVVEAPPNSAPTMVQVVDPTGWSTESVLMLGLLVLAAVRTVAGFIAPRTKTTLDDRLVERLDAILSLVPRQPVPVPQSMTVVVDKPRDPQAGFVGRDMLITLAFAVVVAIGGGVIACATVRPTATRGADAFVSCQEASLRAAAQDLVPLAKSAILRWLSGDGRGYDTAGIKADAQQIKTDIGRCAFEAAIAILSTPPEQPAGPTLLAVADPGAVLREYWPAMRADIGWKVAP